MIYIVDAHSYDKNGIPLRASAMSLSLKERGSTATITLDDREGIKVTDILKQWFRDDADPGKNMMWRATKLTDNWSTNTPSLQLEHVINTLKDSIVFGKITPAEITGNSEATTCSAKTTIEWLLKKQVTKDWKLGNFDVDDENQAYNFESDTIYDAIETVCSTLTGVWWEYDTKKYPFTLHIRKRVDTGSNKDPAETMLRCARNIRTISRSVDKSAMYTRFYPIGAEDLHLKDSKNNNAPYVDQNTDKYGIIEHVETDNTITTNSKLKSWAKDELRIHARKIETIEVEGLELSAATGEPMDKIRLGKMCQIVVKTDAVSTDMTYRIIQLSYPDKISKPEVCKITLSNKRDDLPKMVAEAKKKSAKSGRVAARKEKETKQIILNTIKTVRISGPVNNVYTLQYQLVKDTDWQNANPGTFSRAVTSWEVGASKGTITVTAQPQNQKKNVDVRAGGKIRSGNVYTGQIQCKIPYKNSELWINTGAEYTVNAQDVYDDGWSAARQRSDSPTTKVTNRNYISVHVVPTTVDAAAIARQYNLRNATDDEVTFDKNKVDLAYKSGSDPDTFVTVARFNHGNYNLGWNTARSRSDSPTTKVTNRNYIVVHVVPATVDALAEARQYNLRDATDDEVTFDNNKVDLAYRESTDPDTFVTVARYNHGKYNLGWGAARACSDSPTTLTTNKNYIVVHVVPATVDASAEARQYNLRNATDDEVTFDKNKVDLAYRVSSDPDTFVTVARFNHGNYNLGWGAAKACSDSPTTEITTRNYIVVHVVPTTVDGSAIARQYNIVNTDNDDNRVDLAYKASDDPETFITVARFNHGKYTAGWNNGVSSVTVDTVESRTGELDPTATKSGITVRATASNNARKDQHYTLVNHKIDGTNYAEIQEGQQDAIVVARIATVNYSGQQVLYYDSQEYTQGRFITHYHTDNSTNVKITTTNKTVYYS